MNPVEGGQISARQATLLTITVLVATVIIFVPSLTVTIAGQDAWMVPFAATLVAFGITVLVVALERRHPGQSLVQITETVLGRVLGKALSALFVFWLMHTNAIVLREVGDFITTNFLEETPVVVLEGSIALIAAVIVVLGLEVIARMNEVILPLMTVMLATVILLLVKDFEPERLAPVLEHGVLPVLRASATPSAFWGEVVLLGMILPFLERKDQALRVGLWGSFVALLLIVTVITSMIMLFGAEETERIISFIELSRNVRLGPFVERIEAIPIAIWLTGLVIKVAFFLYVAVLALAQWAGLSDYRPLAFPVMAVTSVLASGLVDSVVELLDFLARFWGPYGLTIEFGFPALLLLASLIRGALARRKDRSAEGGQTT